MEHIKQYDVVLVNLDPTVGVEMKKTRPCVVLSPNEMNKFLQTIVIAPVTSSAKPYPTRIEITHQTVSGWIVLDQIRTIDRVRVIKRLGTLSEKEIRKTKNIIKEIFVD
jgi:mRNA interferase MazF